MPMLDRRQFLIGSLAVSLSPLVHACQQSSPWDRAAYRKPERSRVAILEAPSYDSSLQDIIRQGIKLFRLSLHGKTPELAMFGETTILASFKVRPPDYILLIYKDTREYGVGPFGEDPAYGKQILAWVDDHYMLIERIPGEPPTTNRFEIKILKRRS
jgi:hypothetical protein